MVVVTWAIDILVRLKNECEQAISYSVGLVGKNRVQSFWVAQGFSLKSGTGDSHLQSLATWEAQIGRIKVGGQREQIVHETPSPK
jgi:hypothetical protein